MTKYIYKNEIKSKIFLESLQNQKKINTYFGSFGSCCPTNKLYFRF